VKNRVNKFREFEKINEQDEAAAESKPKASGLKGYSAEAIVDRISAMMEIMPDRVKFGVPADNKGASLSYRDANGAIQKIQDVAHYYSSKSEEVKFYCWNISYAGSWDATKSLREKIDEFGGFGMEQNMNLKKVTKYFTANPEDVDNIRSLSISIDAMSIRKSKDDGAEDQNYPQPAKTDDKE
jgi:hypothetical protein